MFIFKEEVHFIEWIAGTVVALIVSGIVHSVAIYGMTADEETWSGQVTRVVYHPRWVSEEISITVDDEGNISTSTYYVTHSEYWSAETTLGEFNISQQDYNTIVAEFGGQIDTEPGYKPNFDSGDRNIYPAQNRTGFIRPVTDIRTWTNRVKAAPSVFSFSKVPEGIDVYDWPRNTNRFQSQRLLGLTGDIGILEWDQLNARLGPTKHVNLILIGFGNESIQMAEYQQAAWVGGKKNDLVICFGGTPASPTWVKVFGWTESDVCKYSIQDLLLRKGVSSVVLPEIEQIVVEQFQAKDWSKFDYLSIQPRFSHFVFLLITMAITQGVFWAMAMSNELQKGDGLYRSDRYYRW